jgi:hypothetical protein
MVSSSEENECSIPIRYGNFIINMARHFMTLIPWKEYGTFNENEENK